MDKHALVNQLQDHLRQLAHEAHTASVAAADEAKAAVTAREKRADARVSIESAGLARGQNRRATRAFAELDALDRFSPGPLPDNATVELGAIVEIEEVETGEGRTFFLAPVGAGVTLGGPGGDGHLSVVTPRSPIGRAVMGHRCNDVIDVTIKGEIKEWTITWIA